MSTWLTKKYYATYQLSYDSPHSGPYTGVVEDMIDGLDPVGGYDQVAGYTIVQVEQGVANQRTVTNWRTNIQNLYTNATENNLEALFNYWF